MNAIPIGNIEPLFLSDDATVYPSRDGDLRSFIAVEFLRYSEGIFEIVETSMGVSAAGTLDANPLVDVVANLDVIDSGNGLFRESATGWYVFWGRDYIRENQRGWCEPQTVNQDRRDEDGSLRSDVVLVRDF